MKLRIKEKDGEYYPQERSFFGWFDITRDEIMLNGIFTDIVVISYSFKKIDDAIDFCRTRQKYIPIIVEFKDTSIVI